MAAPAPLPSGDSIISTIITNIVPPPPLKKRYSYFMHSQKSHHTQRYVIATYLKNKHNLVPITYGLLPNKDCIFFWIQMVRYDDINNAFSLSINNNKMPCIAYIPTQGMLCEKTRFALTLYNYYGENAWKYTPETYHVCYNRNNYKKKWNISDNLKVIFNDEKIWITKRSTGSLGTNMYLFSGKSLQSLETFLEKNYSQRMEVQRKSKRFKYLENYEKYINPNAEILLDSVIIQKYLNEPLLFDKYYKFDIRIFVLLATTNPSVLFYKFAKIRMCASKYDDLLLENPVDDDNNEHDEDEKKAIKNITDKKELSKHITNSFLSRSNKAYDAKTSKINGRATVSDYNGFIQFMYKMAVINKQFALEWFETDKYKTLFIQNKLSLDDIERIIDIKFSNLLSAVYDAAKQSFDNDNKLYNRPCQFLLQGNDIMIDKYGKFWMLEINQTPTMMKDHDENLKNLMKNILKESIDIVMEIRDLKLNGYKVDQYTPLNTPKLWRKGHLNYKNTPLQIVDTLIHNIAIFLDN